MKDQLSFVCGHSVAAFASHPASRAAYDCGIAAASMLWMLREPTNERSFVNVYLCVCIGGI